VARGSCPVCAHPKRAKIDAAIAAGAERLTIAQDHGVTLHQLARHERHGAEGVAAPAPAEEKRRRRGAVRSGATSSAVPPLAAEGAPLRPAAEAVEPCAVCAHAQRSAIESAIASHETATTIARRWFLTVDQVRAHASSHLPPAPPPLQPPERSIDSKASAVEFARAQLERVRFRRAEMLRRFTGGVHPVPSEFELIEAEKAEASSIELLRRCEAACELDERQVLRSVPWQRIQRAIVAALVPWPDAAEAVARRLQALDGVAETEAA
jgi:hypothetical protein